MINMHIDIEAKNENVIEAIEEIRYSLAKSRPDIGLIIDFDQAGRIKRVKIATEGTIKRAGKLNERNT